MNDNSQRSKFHLKIQSRQGIVFEGEVTSVTSFNDTGKFDILSLHSNFISLIKNTIQVRDDDKILKSIDIDTAIIRVKDNSAEIYLGIEGGLTETI